MAPSLPATHSSSRKCGRERPARTWSSRNAAMTILDVCAYLGLAAVGVATINMLLGLLIALRYSPVRLWPHRHINIFRLHNWTAYLVLALIVLHPAVLLLRRCTRFGWRDLLLPIHS